MRAGGKITFPGGDKLEYWCIRPSNKPGEDEQRCVLLEWNQKRDLIPLLPVGTRFYKHPISAEASDLFDPWLNPSCFCLTAPTNVALRRVVLFDNFWVFLGLLQLPPSSQVLADLYLFSFLPLVIPAAAPCHLVK